MAHNKWQHANKDRQKENVVPEDPQNSCLTKSDEEALKIHGLAFENGGYSSDSDSGRSFDEEYYKNKPKPLKITPMNTVTIKKISSNNEQPEVVNVYNADIKKDTFNLSGKSYHQPPLQNIPAINLPFHQILNESRTNPIISQHFRENVQSVAKIPTNRRNSRENILNLPTPGTHRSTQGTTYAGILNVATKVPNSTLVNATGTRITLEGSTGNRLGGNIGSNQKNMYNVPKIPRPAEDVTPGTHKSTQGTTYAGILNVATKVPNSTLVNATGTRITLEGSTGNRLGGNIGSNQRNMYNVPKIPLPAENVTLGTHRSTQGTTYSGISNVPTKIPNSTLVNATGTRITLQGSTGIRLGGNIGSNQRNVYNVPKIPHPAEDVTNSRAHRNTQNTARTSDLPKVVTRVPNSRPRSNTRNSVAPQDVLRPSSRNNHFNSPARRDLHDEAQRNVPEQTSDTDALCEDEGSGSFCGRFFDCLLCRKC